MKYTHFKDEIEGDEQESNVLLVSVMIVGILGVLFFGAHLLIYLW